jgi:aromatic-L-amino-acid/L-tryptophan decarboxylase
MEPYPSRPGSHPDEALPLEPSTAQMRELVDQVLSLFEDHLAGRSAAGTGPSGEPAELVRRLVEQRPGVAVSSQEALGLLAEVAAADGGPSSGGDLAYIPGSGLATSAVADLLASLLNRYTGLPGIAPAAVALEEGVLRWLCETFRLPPRSQAVLLSGGSVANLSALVAARERLGTADRARIYVGAHAHASVRKAARIAGLRAEQVRVCASSDGLRLDPEAVRLAVKEDLAAGLRPMAIVAAAGTTNAGAVDPLDALADLAHEVGTWLHVDAAYGGFFQLTERGRAGLAGIERADSITLDPHKSLFLPFGTGALLVRDRGDLQRAFAEEADYLRDLDDGAGLPDFSELTPELTRAWRGLRLWLPLQLHGMAAFTEALDERLTLAKQAWMHLEADPRVRTWGQPDLSIVPFRAVGDDATQDRLLAWVHAHGAVRLSSTVIDGEVALRLAVLSHRTSPATVSSALELLTAGLDAEVGPARRHGS